MTDIATRVENLSKRYTIGAAQQRHDTLRDALVHSLLPRILRPGSGRAVIHGRIASLLEAARDTETCADCP